MNKIEEFIEALTNRCLKDGVGYFISNGEMAVESYVEPKLSDADKKDFITIVNEFESKYDVKLSTDSNGYIIIRSTENDDFLRLRVDNYCFGYQTTIVE